LLQAAPFSIVTNGGSKMRRFIKLSSEAQDAATWCAARGYAGKTGDPLPANLSFRAWEEIGKNLAWFKLAVHISKTA
jgi:hypothetical protein